LRGRLNKRFFILGKRRGDLEGNGSQPDSIYVKRPKKII